MAGRRTGRGTTGVGKGFTPANSNTRISSGAVPRSSSAPAAPPASPAGGNLGLNSDRLRHAMVQRLRAQGIVDERVLGAMMAVPRHLFVDEAL
ncbi:MAG: protein-L-isoaspartate O-methyltransferase, partial [Bordetella sp.]